MSRKTFNPKKTMKDEYDDEAAVAMVPGGKPGVYVEQGEDAWELALPARRDTAAAIFDRIAIETALAALPAADRAVMELLYAYRCPVGYRGFWPATATEVGRYLGETFPEFEGRPVTSRMIWRKHAAILTLWRGRAVKGVTRRAA